MNDKRDGFRNPKCFARELGGCSEKITREHYVSKSVLKLVNERYGEESKSVLANGLSFQKSHESQSFGISSLDSYILCETHNGVLSDLDRAGKSMFLKMDEMNESVSDPSLPNRELRVDGDALERWILKAMCGGLYSGNFRTNPDSNETMRGVLPPIEWLRILFSEADFPRRWGLFYIPRGPHEAVLADQHVLRIEPIVSIDYTQVGGILVWYFGFQFALNMGNLAPGVPTEFDNALYRPSGIRVQGNGTTLRLDWRNGAQSDELVFEAKKGMVIQGGTSDQKGILQK